MQIFKAAIALWRRFNRPGEVVLARILAALPRPALFGLIHLFGLFNYQVNRSKRLAALASLAYTFPGRYTPAELRHVCKRLFVIRSAKFINFLIYPVMSTRWLGRFTRIQGADHILQAFKRHQGIIFCSIHTGDMNLSVPVVSSFCCGHVIRLGQKDRVQQLASGRVFGTHEPLRDLYRGLRRWETLMLAVDGIAGKKLVPVSFLGHQIFVQPTVARMARQTGCAIVPMISLLNSENYYDLVFSNPIAYQEDLDYPDYAQRVMQSIFQACEPHVLKDPAQWHLWPYLDIMRQAAEDRPEDLVMRSQN
jgi:lauroyl/myristoyl acyltransferase